MYACMCGQQVVRVCGEPVAVLKASGCLKSAVFLLHCPALLFSHSRLNPVPKTPVAVAVWGSRFAGVLLLATTSRLSGACHLLCLGSLSSRGWGHNLP